MTLSEFDYVVVGGGSAGCCVAGRLSEDQHTSVCLLEAGGPDNSVFVRAPLGFAATASLNLNSWGYNTVPATRQSDGRQLFHQRHGLHARQCPRLRQLGCLGQPGLVLSRCFALL